MKIRFAGFGGQGIVLSGLITGLAGTIHGKNALQTQTYGSASRGGVCKSDVCLSSDKIYELEFDETDVLVAMSQPSLSKYGKSLSRTGVLFIDPDLVKSGEGYGTVHKIPATTIAIRDFGKKVVGNLVMLGFMTAVLEFVPKEAMEKAIASKVPKGTETLNISAFQNGFAKGKKV